MRTNWPGAVSNIVFYLCVTAVLLGLVQCNIKEAEYNAKIRTSPGIHIE